MTKILLALMMALALTACGVRGDPEPPAYTQQ
jgi:predicted small lipoprotein YifL